MASLHDHSIIRLRILLRLLNWISLSLRVDVCRGGCTSDRAQSINVRHIKRVLLLLLIVVLLFRLNLLVSRIVVLLRDYLSLTLALSFIYILGQRRWLMILLVSLCRW